MRATKLAATMILLLLGSVFSFADEAKTVPQWYLDQIVDNDPNPLPRHLAPSEIGLHLPAPSATTPPTGTIHAVGEYEYQQGIFISWGSFNAVLTELTVGITTGDPDGIVYIAVDGPSEQASAETTLAGAGADLDQVEFITYATDSVWMRDYGPRSIFENGVRAFVDHAYNRPRPLDDAFPDHVASLWNETQYDMPLEHGGGNFHLTASGDAFMSELILTENPGLTEQDVIDHYQDYLGVDLTITDGFPTSFDSTQHIDMWMLPVSDTAMIIGQYDSTAGTPYTITEGMVSDIETRGYTVHRTPGWNSGGTHYTYTNSVIFNDLVFIPRFGGSFTTEDAQALAVFQTAFPNHQILQVDCASIIRFAGAIHCIVMQLAGNPPIFKDDFESGGFTAWSQAVGGP